jgi:16S rRNA processing protein RimM
MEYLATGILKAPHGVHGFLKLFAFSNEYGHLVGINEVLLRKDGKERKCIFEEVRISGNDALVKIKGVDNPETASTYTGWEIWVPREAAAPLEEGEYYVADLSACALVSNGAVVAHVVSVIDGSQALLLEVESVADGKRYLVPFMDQYVGKVDIGRKELELTAPWLLS